MPANIYNDESRKSYKDNIAKASETSFMNKTENRTILTNARHIKEFGWILIVEQAEDKALRPIFKTLVINLAICAGITVFVLLLVLLIIKAYKKKIDTLRGIVPICAYCKQIRDDKGYWNQVEEYVSRHTDAEFSHGICPDCIKKHFPQLD